MSKFYGPSEDEIRDAEHTYGADKLTPESLAVLIARLAYESGKPGVARAALNLLRDAPTRYDEPDGGPLLDPFADLPESPRRADGHRAVDEVLAKRTAKRSPGR